MAEFTNEAFYTYDVGNGFEDCEHLASLPLWTYRRTRWIDDGGISDVVWHCIRVRTFEDTPSEDALTQLDPWEFISEGWWEVIKDTPIEHRAAQYAAIEDIGTGGPS